MAGSIPTESRVRVLQPICCQHTTESRFSRLFTLTRRNFIHNHNDKSKIHCAILEMGLAKYTAPVSRETRKNTLS